MFALILFLPLLGFFYASLAGRYFGRTLLGFLSPFIIFVSFLLSVYCFYEVVLLESTININLYSWVVFDIVDIRFGLIFDSLTCMMLLIITGISFLVHVYSYGYMSEDPYIIRFFSYLSLFTFFMIFLVTADNYVQLFVGWEGVGLCSYLLINFWYTRVLANKAALKAMIMNRIADVFFLFAIAIIINTFKTSDFLIVFNLIPYIENESLVFFNYSLNKVSFISFLLAIGAIGKSAQLGLHTWLPDAMEGPTPVSSLLHAATMVTAGVYLIIRSSFFFEYSSNILVFISIIGGLTAFFFAIIGTFQFDVKKIIAYSTCSQLGYMFFSCGLSNYYVAIFHLFNHAFFKALLFLSAGSLIHALFDEQDMRKMGGLLNFLPFTYFCFLVGSLAIMGFPFLTGFYSKDLVLELAYSRYILDSNFIHFLGVSAAFFTSLYSIRLLLFVFFYNTNIFKSYLNLHESGSYMFFSMFILVFFSVFIGYFANELFAGWGTYAFGNSIYVLPSNFNYIDAEFLHPLIKNLPFILSLLGLFLGVLVADILDRYTLILNTSFLKVVNKISTFFYNAGFFNTFFNDLFIFILKISYIVPNKYGDKGFFELFGPFGLYKLFRKMNIFLTNVPPQVIFFHIGFMFFFLIIFLLYFFLQFYIPGFLFLNPGILVLVNTIMLSYIFFNK